VGGVVIALAMTCAPSTIGGPQAPGDAARPAGRDYPVRPVPFTAVHLDDVFWAPRIAITQTETIPFAFQMCERTGRVDNFVRAATVLRGERLENTRPPGYPFDDSDVFKVIEGAAYALSVRPDPRSTRTSMASSRRSPRPRSPTATLHDADDRSEEPASLGRDQAVGAREGGQPRALQPGPPLRGRRRAPPGHRKRTLLDVALKSADLLTRTFGPGKAAIWAWPPGDRDGPREAVRVTGEPKYLELARFLLDVRGPDGDEGAGREYNQSHLRVVEQAAAVGHAVRATYLYSGMADVAALTGDTAYLEASDAIWRNVVSKKLYVTGGIGATGRGEAFGDDYELPNMSAYARPVQPSVSTTGTTACSCSTRREVHRRAGAGALQRARLGGGARRQDLLLPESPGVDRPARAQPLVRRRVLPVQLTRFLTSLPGYLYAVRGDTLYVNLYAQGTADIDLGRGRTVTVAQRTRYPWDGEVALTLTPNRPTAFTLNVRIPGWARNEPVPSDLYRFRRRDGRTGEAGDQRHGRGRRTRQGVREPEPPRGRRVTSSGCRCRCRSAGWPPTSGSKPIAGASRCSGVRWSTPPSGPTTRAAACATWWCRRRPRSRASSAPTCSGACRW